MNQTPEQKQAVLLMMTMMASNANSDYCAFQLQQLDKRVMRHEVKMLFNQMRSINERLLKSLQRNFGIPEGDYLNNLSDSILQASFVMIAAPPELRDKLIEDMTKAVEEQSRLNKAA
jgi:hypothetical protein